jgi:AcrR family transcriptional regulator
MTTTSGQLGGRRRRSPKRPEDRLSDLLDASLETFRVTGLESATVAEITERAGVAKGTFYLYFPSKDHVLGAIWGRYVDGYLDRTADLLAADDPGRDWRPVFEQLVDALVRHSMANAELHRMVYRSANGRALQQCRAGNERVIVVLVDAVRAAAAAGQIDVEDPELSTRFLYHGLHGLLDDLTARDATAERPTDVDDMVRVAQAFAGRVLRPTTA